MAVFKPLGFIFMSQLMSLVLSDPQISFPINSQLPPVARLGEPFSYAFSPFTFRSDSNITYTLGEHPDWISIATDERRLHGIPTDKAVPAGQVVGQVVEIIATDDTGSTTMNSTLVVSRQESPVVKTPLSEQISKFGHYSAPSSLLLYPSTNFKYTFDKDTFDHSNAGLNYYASSGNSSPLPSWVLFDESTLTLSGETPAFETLIQPPQNFSFQLVASDVVGFSAASIDFSIVVGSHKLTTNTPVIQINATRGQKLQYNKLGDGVRLDDKPVATNDLQVEATGVPKWLNFDKSNWRIQGTPGADAKSTNVTFSFSDPFADTLDVVLMINIETGLFKSTLEDIEAQPGEMVEINLSSYLRDPNDVAVKINISPKQDWLKVSGTKLSGRVPEKAEGLLSISVEASSKSSDLSETETMNIKFLQLDGSTTTSSSATSSDPTATASATETDGDSDLVGELQEDEHKRVPTSTILLATLIPILSLALILLAIICCRRRRRSKETYLNSNYRTQISNPMLDTLVVNGKPTPQHTIEKSGIVMNTTVFDPDKPQAAVLREYRSRPSSSRSRSSMTVSSRHDFLAAGAVPHSLRTVADPPLSSENDSHRSWITVEDGRGNRELDLQQRQSVTTLPESMAGRQTLSGDGTFRSGLDVAIPSFSDLSILPEVMSPSMTSPQQPRPMDALSSASSGVFPSATPSPFNMGTVLMKGTELRPVTAPPIAEEPEVVKRTGSTREPPARASWLRRMSGMGNRSSTHTGSFTESSFGSGENWKVVRDSGGSGSGSGSGSAGVRSSAPGGYNAGQGIGRGGSLSYHNLGERAQSNQTRPMTSAGGLGVVYSPGYGRDADANVRRQVEEWRREQSPGMPEGGSNGSFAAFI